MSNDLQLKLTLKADGRQLSGALKTATGDVVQFGQRSEQAAQTSAQAFGKTRAGVQSISEQLQDARHQLLAFVGVSQALSAGQQMVQTVASYQDMTTKLEGLSTTAAAFAENEQYLIDLSQEHHKNLLTLGDGYSRILSLEEAQIVSREQGRAILEGLSNASSRLGASNVQLEQSLYGLAQGLSAGTLRAEELNQITEPLPGLLQALDRASGQAAGGFRQLVNDGQVTSDMFRDILIVAFQDYEGAAAATADNLSAKFTDVQNSYTLLARSLEQPVGNALIPVLDGISDGTRWVSENTEELSTVLGVTLVTAATRSAGAFAVSTAATVQDILAKRAAVAEELKLAQAQSIATAAALRHAQAQTGLTVAHGSAAKAAEAHRLATQRLAVAQAATRGAGRALLGVLGGPVGLAITAGLTAAAFIDWGDSTQSAIAGTDLLTKSVDGLTAAQARQQLQQLQPGFASAKEEAQKFANEVDSLRKNLRMMTPDTDVMEQWQRQLIDAQGNLDTANQTVEQYNKKLAELEAITQRIKGQSDSKPITPPVPDKTLESFAKLAAAHNEQIIALELGARAQYEYQLQQKGFEPQLQQTLLAQYDYIEGLKERQKAEKEAADAQRGDQKLLDTLKEERELIALNGRDLTVETQVRQLSAQATGEQVAEVKRLAGALYDTAAAQKKAAEEQEAFKRQLDDANTAAKRFLQDGNLGEIEGLESIQDQLQEAMSVEGITDKMKEDFIDATDKIQDRISAIKFDNMTNGLAAGMSSLQSMFESGTEGYKAMEIGLAAVTAAQAVHAVINQASGDPYTAFARMTAMAAAVAQLGVSINGAGSFDTAERRQASQGTGTVLGDSSAKSESILRSNETIAEAVEQIVGINRSMLDALLSLEVSINGAALQITRRWDDNITAPSNVELSGVSAVSGIFSSISEALDILDLGKVFAAAIGASVKGKDSGLVLEASTLDQLTAQSYTTWKERKNWLDDYDREWDYSALDPQITQQLRLVMAGIADSVSTGADQLGLSAGAIDQAVQSFALERTLISLKGLTGEEQQEELQTVFSSIFDDLSGHVMPWLTEFQQAGEGLGETLSRLATETSAVDNVVSMLGLTFSTVDDQLKAKTNLVSVLGGLETFVSAYSSFSDAFLDEEQQFSNARDQLQSAFSQYDAILPATRADYLGLVQAQDAATESGARNIAKLFELSDAADEYYSMLEDREDERLAVARERSGLMRQIYELEGNSAAALQIARDAELAALDESNRALQQRIWMLQDEADQESLLASQAATAFGQLGQAIDAELEALNSAWSDRQQALNDEIHAVSQSASAIQTFIDALSNTLSQLQATTQQDFIDAQQQAFDWLNQGQAAWTDPGNYQDVLGHLGNINADWYASAVDYERDKKITANALTDAKALASSQLSVEDQTLQTLQNTLTLEERAYDQSVAALEATREFWQQEIDAINGVDDAVLSVEDAIQKLKDVLQDAMESLAVTSEDIRWWMQQNGNSQLTVDDIVSAMQQTGVTGSQVADALDLTPTDNLSTTEQSIRQWLNANPNASDDEVASAMRIWGVSVERLAEMLNMTVTEVQQRYVATVPEQVLDKAHLPTSAGLSDTDVETWLNQNGGATLAQVADAMREFGVTLEQMARVSGWSLEAVEAAYLGLADGQGRTPDQLYVDGRQEQPAVPAPAPTIRYPQDGGISDAEVQAWLAQNSGATLAQIADAMDAFGVTVQQMARATGWSVSDVQSAYQIHGSHANGLDEVPFDNYLAFLHKGEMVVPAQQSDYLRTAETSKQFKALVQEMAALRADNKVVLAQISKHTKDSANTAKALSRGQPVYIMENL